ncbi:MAG TPA: metal ABC transporter ATP-binding protein [Patescibacteria group bacterium]|nr:metal ABC transporter ATP-binding protein [Patescibacteria group bacterium]
MIQTDDPHRSTPTHAAIDERPAIRLRGVAAGYGDRLALEGIDLDVPAGSLLAVIGPNGSGKSTLLKVIAGLLEPRAGSVEVLGGPPGVAASRVGYVPQAETVDWEFPVTVGEVVMMGRVPRIGILRGPGRADRAAVDAALRTVGMDDQVDRQIGALSGGQRRRVFLARALASEPDVYLLDEPVTGVDATTQEDLMAVLEAEAQRGKTVVATTHDLACAAHRFQEAALVNRRIIATGPAKDLILDQRLLAETYGGHVLVLPDLGAGALVLDDAHHHDEDAGTERHFHDDGRL